LLAKEKEKGKQNRVVPGHKRMKQQEGNNGQKSRVKTNLEREKKRNGGGSYMLLIQQGEVAPARGKTNNFAKN